MNYNVAGDEVYQTTFFLLVRGVAGFGVSLPPAHPARVQPDVRVRYAVTSVGFEVECLGVRGQGLRVCSVQGLVVQVERVQGGAWLGFGGWGVGSGEIWG